MVQYSLRDGVATITLDDGKRNALSPAMIAAIDGALRRARADDAIVILTGRPDTFSAGFDLKVMGGGPLAALRMLGGGFALTATVLSHPRPVIAASTGHTLAMGVFLLLSADHTIGSQGDYRIAANEVAIGLPLPRVAAAMLEHRLRPADYQRAAVLAETFSVEAAAEAGFFDEVVEPAVLMARAQEKAAELSALDAHAHRVTKRRLRRGLIRRIRWSIPLDLLDAVILGIRRARG